MVYAFDGRALGQVLVETERLAEQSRDHERRLTRLVTDLEGPGQPAMTDLLLELRHLCGHTRDQRLQLESMLTRLIGTPPADDQASRTRARVLIADDSAEQREAAARALEEAGFEALTVANGLEALMSAHYVKPSVAIMGVSMPILDGIEAARLLKASPSTRHVRVVAYTAWPSFYDGPLKSVFDGVLAKPSTAAALIAAVRRFAGDEPARSAAAGA
jgi:two-component system, OmpR family, alkaline phosphatase synthesis response regulator PhoP